MSKPLKFIWPVASTTAIALPQTLAAAGNLQINGTLAKTSVLSTSSPLASRTYVELPGIRRTVSLTSTGNLAAITFTITGMTDGGREISVNKAGPNNNTVYTNFGNGEVFHTITSVSASAPVGTNVSVGTGLEGYTLWYRNDYHRVISNLTVAVNVTANITYSFQTTLDDPDFVQTPFVYEPIDGVTIPTVPAASDMIDSNVDVISNFTFPTHSSRIEISTSDATGALEAWFLQQGLK